MRYMATISKNNLYAIIEKNSSLFCGYSFEEFEDEYYETHTIESDDEKYDFTKYSIYALKDSNYSIIKDNRYLDIENIFSILKEVENLKSYTENDLTIDEYLRRFILFLINEPIEEQEQTFKLYLDIIQKSRYQRLIFLKDMIFRNLNNREYKLINDIEALFNYIIQTKEYKLYSVSLETDRFLDFLLINIRNVYDRINIDCYRNLIKDGNCIWQL